MFPVITYYYTYYYLVSLGIHYLSTGPSVASGPDLIDLSHSVPHLDTAMLSSQYCIVPCAILRSEQNCRLHRGVWLSLEKCCIYLTIWGFRPISMVFFSAGTPSKVEWNLIFWDHQRVVGICCTLFSTLSSKGKTRHLKKYQESKGSSLGRRRSSLLAPLEKHIICRQKASFKGGSNNPFLWVLQVSNDDLERVSGVWFIDTFWIAHWNHVSHICWAGICRC